MLNLFYHFICTTLFRLTFNFKSFFLVCLFLFAQFCIYSFKHLVHITLYLVIHILHANS